MISWDLLKRVYGFVGSLPNPEKMKEIEDVLSEQKTFLALKNYVEKVPLDSIAKTIGMVLQSENPINFFLDNLRYYNNVSIGATFSLERILSNPEIENSLEIYPDEVLRTYYKGDYKSRKELLHLCSKELENMLKVSLPYSQSSLYADKRVIRINTESGHTWYKVKELRSILSKNSNFLPKDTKEQLLRCISNKFIQWGYGEDGLIELQSILLH